MMISINKNFINDPFYRYKMERIQIVTKNNKTIVNNIVNISNTLKTDPKILFKFITKNLNTFGFL